MNRVMLCILVTFLLASVRLGYAHVPTVGSEIANSIYTISRGMGDHFVRSADRIDSLRATLSDEELKNNEYYFVFSDAYVAYVKGDYGKTLRFAERALEHFLYSQEDEWVARSLMLIGNTAATKRLIPEAVEAYRRVIGLSKDPHTLCAAYLNMARNRRSLKLDWEEAMDLAKVYCEQADDDALRLNLQMVNYWVSPDSGQIEEDIPLIGEKFHRLGHYAKEADAYKCLVFYYINNEQYDKALISVDKSLAAYLVDDRPSKVLLSSIHHLKGKVLMLLQKPDLASEEYNMAIDINNKAGNNDHNYSLYRSLYGREYRDRSYKEACFFLVKADESYRRLFAIRMEYYDKMATIFKKITIIEEEVVFLEKQATRRTIVTSFLLISFFTLIILWLRSRKNHFERISHTMEGMNIKLQEETGELLNRVNENNLKQKIIKSQFDLERKMDKYLLSHKIMADVVKEKYAETMLCFGIKLSFLSDTERKYAVMIALEVPYKTIAEMLHVTPGTVAQYRNRLRKKLGISNTEMDLNTYLKTLLED